MTPLHIDITGTTLEIRVTQLAETSWRWLLCAVDVPRTGPRENHRTAWGGKASSAKDAFNKAMDARNDVLNEYEPQ